MLYNLYDTIKNVYIGLILLTFVILFFIVLKIVHLTYGSNSWYKSNINNIFPICFLKKSNFNMKSNVHIN